MDCSTEASHLIRTDVTAVKLLNDLIIAGIGSWLHFYHKKSSKFLKVLKALNGQKVYGIRPSIDNSKLLVFGGKQLTVISIEIIDDLVKSFILLDCLVCEDWLHSGVWLNTDSVAVLTAHNTVQIWDTSKQKILTTYRSSNNSILYSGLLLPLEDDVLVFAGTVFSDVIVHRCQNKDPLLSLKGHRGVIFSITCDADRQIIVTTSDDRSLRVWGPNETVVHPFNTKEYWETVDIVCRHEVYGHLARVMRSFITNELIISVGEDSAICFWDPNGKLLRKNMCHQNGCIWSLDADKIHLVTGGGDNGLILHPLTVATEYGINEILDIDNPKKVLFTARKNIVILNESHKLLYYDLDLKLILDILDLEHESSFVIMSLSECKQIIAVADMSGNLNIFTESCKGEPSIKNILSTKLAIGKLLSMQWAGNRHLVFCAELGMVSIVASKGCDAEVVRKFELPHCKERWLTASAIDSTSEIFVLGDRCGNIHVFKGNKREPIKTFNRVHGRYGPTSITVKGSEIITTGRDGTIKHFILENDFEVKYMNSMAVYFDWVEKFLDKNCNIVCGFQERSFVIFNIRNNSKLLEVPCGGGHRSWDAVRFIEKKNDSYEEFINLIYLKNSNMHLWTFQLSKIVSQNFISGTHTKEINCLKSYSPNRSVTYYVSGGEDTTVRISSSKKLEMGANFQDELIFKNLSSVRALKILPLDENRLILASAGGRAQLCVKIIKFLNIEENLTVQPESVIDHLIKGTDKERKGNQSWRNPAIDFDPETRIMDIDLKKLHDNEFAVFAGCSDACLRVFKFQYNPIGCSMFEPLGEVKNTKTCILKTKIFKFQNQHILITSTTRGELVFWDISNDLDLTHVSKIKPVFNTNTNKSGINAIAIKVISNNDIILATGGDDNTVHVRCFNVTNNVFRETHATSSDRWHCSQITGIEFIQGYLVITSIDQRVTLCKWSLEAEIINLLFVSQCISDVADIQGLEVVEDSRSQYQLTESTNALSKANNKHRIDIPQHKQKDTLVVLYAFTRVLEYSSDSVTVCVFGKGIEVMEIKKPR